MKIRKYMALGFLGIVVFPWFVYLFVHVLDTHTWQPWASRQSQAEQTQLTSITRMMTQSSAYWTNPVWQQRVTKQLSQAGLEAVIRSPANQVIFETRNVPNHPGMWDQQVMVVQDGRLLGTVQLSASPPGDPMAFVAALLALVFAISFVGWQSRRNVIRPLEAMSQAALQIAEGDLDFELPQTRTVEIAQVRKAFYTMTEGLREAFRKQAKLEEERRFFIGAIAHDLRTPLFSLRGYLDGLEQGVAASPEKVAKYAAVCKEKADHLDRLVSDLFAFTKLEYMEQTLVRGEVNLCEVITKAADSLRPQAEAKNVHVHLELPRYSGNDGGGRGGHGACHDGRRGGGEDGHGADHDDRGHGGRDGHVADCLTTGDAHLLERAVTNLIDNAVRYTPEGGGIKVQLHAKADRLFLTIRDTGPGFAPGDISHVFEPMYRGETSRNRDTGGTGLGLTISRRIFRSHGGELTAENASDGGAVLSGWIPRV